MRLTPSFQNGFYAPERGGRAAFPSLWRGCIGHWSMGLGPTGTTLRDQSVLRNHGTMLTMTPANAWVMKDGHYAMKFDKDDAGRIETAGLKYPDFSGFTAISMHTRVFVLTGNPATASVVRKDGTFNLQFVSNLRVGLWAPTLTSFSTATISFDVWYNFTFLWDNEINSSTPDFFLNGVKSTYGSGASGAITSPATNELVFGATETGDEAFNGYLQVVTFWNRKLSDREALLLNSRPGIMDELAPRKIYSGAAAPPAASSTYSIFRPTVIGAA